MTDYQHEIPHDDAPFFAAAEFGDAPPTASAPIFRPVVTGPAKTSDEALDRLANEIVDLAAQEEAAFDRLADTADEDPQHAAVSAEAERLESGVKGRLTMMVPVRADTPAGLAAKGRAALAYRKTINGCVVAEAAPLLLSMAEDAVRLAMPTEPAAEIDADVIALAKRVARLARMELRAFGRVHELEDKVDSMLPKRPDGAEAQRVAEAARRAEMAKIGNVLDYRFNDPVFTEAVEKASAAAERARAPFVAAQAARESDKARLLRETGAEAAAQRQSRLTDRLEAIGLRLAGLKPYTLAGCVAMAEAARTVSAIGISGGWGATLHEAVTSAIAQLQTTKPAKPRPVRPTTPDRLAMESYRTWLEREHRALTHEMYPGQPEAVREVYLNNPGGRFHFRGEAPASSRAEQILAFVGVDWRNDPVAERDHRHEQAA